MELDGARDNFLTRLNKSLDAGWQCKLNQDGRLYYLNHNNKTSLWIPPRSNWSLVGDLPYGWESARDKNGKEYYINHRTCSTTREDPFDLEEAPPEQRDVVLVRDSALGFGFIAGSERPVVIRSVTEGGPSIGKLLPGDEILKVNGEDVKNSDRQYIIDKIRYSTDEIALSVIQPYIDKTGLKSSFLSATKKQKLKAKPPRVRFADNVNTFPSNAPKMPPSLVYLPNVLKVYLENEQTKSFKYDDSTTVKEVLVNLKEKLGLKCLEYFSLVVEDVRVPSQQKFVILQENEALRQIAERPGSQNWKCHLRITYIPCDAYDLLNEDAQAFEYFYQQCCNDVLQERFSPEMKPETAMRLASLHIHQHLLASKQNTKVSLKVIEKEDGLSRFLPKNILSHWKAKELRKMISQHMKQNQSLTAPGQKHLTELQAKLHYLKIFGTLRSFGTRTFLTTILDFPDVDQQSDASVIIGPRCDISLLAKTGDWAPVLEFNQLTRILLTVECGTEEGVHRLELHQKSGQPVVFLMPSEDAQQMASFINGYYRLLVNRNRTLLTETSMWMPPAKTEAPPYYGKHHVSIAKWNYPDDLVSEVISEEVNNADSPDVAPKRRKTREGEQWVDLSAGPPPYQADLTYIRNLNMHERLQNIPESAEEEPDNREDVAESNPVHVETKAAEPEVSPVELDDSSPQSEDSQLSEEKADSEKEEEILSLLSSGASSPESDGSISSASGAIANDSNRKSEVKSKRAGNGKKRDRSLTEGISKKIFRSITGMKFNVKDTVASNDSENVTATEVKFISSSPMKDKSLESESDSAVSAEESPVKDDGNEERPNSRLRARDSILIQHRKISPRMQRRQDSEDSDSYEDTEAQSKSFDSDIIDLTNIGDFDFDSDLSPSKSNGAYDDVFLDDDEVRREGDEKREVEFHVGSEEDGDISARMEDDSEMLVLGNESDVELDLPGFENDDGEKDEHKTDNHIQRGEQEGKVDDEDDVPVSVIDALSPEPTLTSPMETSDEAHGMQLAALVALNASLEEPEEPLQAAAKSPDNECESDSGNETISSEIDNNNTEHTSIYQSPRDYAPFDTASNSNASVDILVEAESSSTISLKDEDIHEPYCCAAGCATSSDTESTSTLHGSSPNLSAIDLHLGEDRVPSVQPKNIDDVVLPSLEAPETSGQSAGVGGYVDDIEALIATLVVPPPPLVDSGEIDEELLQAILPPPQLEGFDEGAIEGAFPQTNPSESDEEDSVAETNILTNISHRSDAEEGAVGDLVTALDSLEMPSAHDEPDMTEVLDISDSIKSNNEMNLNSSLNGEQDCEVTYDRYSEDTGIQQNNGDNDETDKDLESDLGDFEEEAGLRELLELTLSNALGSIHATEQNESAYEEQTVTSFGDILNHSKVEDIKDDSCETESPNRAEENEEELTPRPSSLGPDDNESNGEDDLLEVQYDSYGHLRGHGSPEQKVANILDAIIAGGLSPSASTSSNLSTPSYDRPLNSPHDVDSKLRGIQQSKLQGSVDSGFHQPDPDQVSVTSPSDPASLSSMDNNGILDALVSTPDACPQDIPAVNEISESTAERIVESNVEKPVVRPKIVGGKPSVPPKPPKPARPKDLHLKLIEPTNDTELRKSNKYPAPQPPQPPPRKRYKAPSIAAKASRFESTNVYTSHVKGSPERFATLPKSFTPPLDGNDDSDPSEKPELTRLYSDGDTYGDQGNLQEKQKRGKSVTRSQTFSDSSPTKDSSKPFPSRKAPPAPLPKPKINSGMSPTISGKSSSKHSKESSSATSSPSLSKKQSFTGSLSRLLTPHKSKTWGQFKDSLPFKQGSFKGNVGSSRSKSKSRKPLKALWPSATCDTPGDTTLEVQENRSITLEKVSRGVFQRSESAEFDTKPDYSLEVRARSFSMNMIRNNSEDSTSESDMETPKGSPNLRQGGTLKGRPSSMISLTESYPPPFYHPRRPPPPRPSNPPVLKAASLSKLSTRMYVQTGPISPIPPSSPAVSPEPVPSPSNSFDTDTEVSSPTPPPLPTTNPPDFSKPAEGSSPIDDQYCNGNNNANLIIDIESRDYVGETAISGAIQDIELLADDMRDSISRVESQPNVRQFRQNKESLLSEVREFTSNTKMVVSAAGQPGQQLKDCTNSSMHTLARLCSATQASMDVMSSTSLAKNLGKKVEDVARNFGATLAAASEAHGKPLSDPKMQQLLRKAQTMAALLSALMRSLRMLQH